MDSPEGLADNYGWYFVQGLPAYSPSATDAGLDGDYFSVAATLTPDFVRDVARRYLGAQPATIIVTPRRAPVQLSPGSTSLLLPCRSGSAYCGRRPEARRSSQVAVATPAPHRATPTPALVPTVGRNTFPAPSVSTLPNGAVLVASISNATPLAGTQIFVPAGLMQQPQGKAGIAAVTAALVLATPVEGPSSTEDVANTLGADVTYTIDPEDTRFYVEARAGDAARLLRDLGNALEHPDAAQFERARSKVLNAAAAAAKTPALAAYGMVRQALYAGTGFSDPDTGSVLAIRSFTSEDARAFAMQYRHGPKTAVAISGDVTGDLAAAARNVVASFPATAGSAPAQAQPAARGHQIVAHRDVATPWVAVAYTAPSQYSADFPAMLVIEALLGRGGGVHSLSYEPGAAPPEDFLGGYYQYEAQPGTFVEFYNGGSIDQDLTTLTQGVGRLRAGTLQRDLIDRAKKSAVGSFLTSVTTLEDESWLLGRAALSPGGIGFENDLPVRIAAVTPADVQRVARKYLTAQTVAVVLPSGGGQ
jgi:zinc protease